MERKRKLHDTAFPQRNDRRGTKPLYSSCRPAQNRAGITAKYSNIRKKTPQNLCRTQNTKRNLQNLNKNVQVFVLTGLLVRRDEYEIQNKRTAGQRKSVQYCSSRNTSIQLLITYFTRINNNPAPIISQREQECNYRRFTNAEY